MSASLATAFVVSGRVLDDVGSLVALLREHSNLKNFTMERCFVSDGCVAGVAEVLGSCSTLRHLQFRNNQTTSLACRLLLAAVRGQTRLQTLDLENAPLGDDGARLLAEVLSARSLRTLALNGCGITADGCRALVPVMRSSASLQLLFLDQNPIGDAGVALVASALAHCTGLELHCGGCGMRRLPPALCHMLHVDYAGETPLGDRDGDWMLTRPALLAQHGWCVELHHTIKDRYLRREISTLFLVHELRGSALIALLPYEMLFALFTWLAVAHTTAAEEHGDDDESVYEASEEGGSDAEYDYEQRSASSSASAVSSVSCSPCSDDDGDGTPLYVLRDSDASTSDYEEEADGRDCHASQ